MANKDQETLSLIDRFRQQTDGARPTKANDQGAPATPPAQSAPVTPPAAPAAPSRMAPVPPPALPTADAGSDAADANPAKPPKFDVVNFLKTGAPGQKGGGVPAPAAAPATAQTPSGPSPLTKGLQGLLNPPKP